jgi:hypothetical protein
MTVLEDLIVDEICGREIVWEAVLHEALMYMLSFGQSRWASRIFTMSAGPFTRACVRRGQANSN